MLVINKISAAVAALLVFAVVFVAHPANARPYQYIPEVPGWIPVYIRQGDQPLSDVHPALAEAFREDIQPIRLDESANKNLLTDVNDNSAESELPAKGNDSSSAFDATAAANSPVEKNDFPQKTQTTLAEKESVVMKIPKPSAAPDKAEFKRLAKELNKRNKKTE